MKKFSKFLFFLTFVFLLVTGSILRQRHLAAGVIRLHIRADSDSEADQREKLLVRDALLPEIERITGGCTARGEAIAALSRNAARLGRTASAVAGKPVTVQLGPEWFETRRYDGFSLPAGRYLALCVSIGSGSGHNWWCTAFPSVCTAATAEELTAVAVSGGLSGSDLRMMTAKEPDIEVRYWVLELLARLRAALFPGRE